MWTKSVACVLSLASLAAIAVLLTKAASADTVGTPISVAPATDPVQVKLSPNESQLYVSDQGGTVACPGFPAGSVSVIATGTDSLTATVGVGVDPGPIRFTSDGSKAYVVNQSDCDPNGTVSVIDVATHMVMSTVTVGQFPITLTISLDNSKVYVANKGSNSVSVICTGLVPGVCASADTVIKTIALDGTKGINPHVIDKNPSGSEVWVAQQDCPAGTGCISSNVAVISTATDSLIANVGVGPTSGSIHFTPDGSRGYVATRGNGTLGIAPTVVDVNAATHLVTATIPITPPSFPTDAAPHAMRVTPNGAKLYVADKHSNDVAVICTGIVPAACAGADVVLQYIAVATAPDRVEISGDGSRLYAVSEVPATASGTVSVICTGYVAADCAGGATDSVIATLTVGSNPIDIEINCADTKAYVSNSASNSISPITLTGLGSCTSPPPCSKVPLWPVPTGDSDCDGFSTTIENFVGTNPLVACGPNDWPPDFNSDTHVNLNDVVLLKPHFNSTAGPSSVAYSPGEFLAADMSSTLTTLSASGTGILNGQAVQVDSEQMKVTAGGGTASLTVQRGYNGTAAATHLSNAGANPIDYVAYDRRFDLNADGRVNLNDIVILKPFFNLSCTP